MIFKKQLTLAATVVILQCLVAFPLAAQPGEQDTLRVERIKRQIATVPAGQEATIMVRARATGLRVTQTSAGETETKITIGNTQEIQGTISEAGDDYFIVTDARNRQWTKLGYEHVLKVVGFSTPLETARSFERVLLLVKPGDKITVLDSSGRFSKGKIAELSPSSLRLFVNRTVHDFPADQIREIIQRRSDHLGLTKGVVIGSGIALGLTILAVAGGCGECVGAGLALTGLGAGIGAGIGAALDGVIRHDVTIYRAPGRTSSRLATENRREPSSSKFF